MDKITNWLIRIASSAVILIAIGIPIYLVVSEKRNLFLSEKKELENIEKVKQEKLTNLRNAMKQVAARLSAGTSLRDSTISFQPVIDALAVAEEFHRDSFEVKNAKKASQLFEVLQTAWDTRIRVFYKEASEYLDNKVYDCEALKLTADEFERVYGSKVINWQYKKGLFGMTSCQVPYGSLPEDYMRPIIINLLRREY